MAENNMRVLIALAIIGLFGIITFALSAAILGNLNRRFNDLDQKLNILPNPTTTTTTTTTTAMSSEPPSLNGTLVDAVRIEDLMNHLEEFERFAQQDGNTRAIGTNGFAKTLDYIENYLKANSHNQLNVFRQNCPIQNFSIKGTPFLDWSWNGQNENFTYSPNLAKTDFTYVNYSIAINRTTFNLVLVKNNGCDDGDYVNVANHAVLIMAGGTCTYAEKGEKAASKNVTALLFYNHGSTTSSLAPVSFRLRQANRLPALSLSYAVGQKLANALNTSGLVNVTIEIQREDYGTFIAENICADTIHGMVNETIIVGSHSDSVPAGPGINDNGSGSSANLVLAVNLARLYATNNYQKYRSRIRFCWWAAEEIGLVGAIHHVQQAQITTVTDENRLSNYLINLNYDMLGSPNYIFGIYNGSSAKLDTPQQALKGSIRISEAFRDWFGGRNLPWDYTDFSGRSDYGPFLAAGIVAGGLFSGADERKSATQRDKYNLQLGEGQGGLAGATLDPCYHLECDNVKNIDRFGYLKMVQAAAYMLEFLGHKNDLATWLYPDGRPAQIRLPDDYFPKSDYFRES